MTPTETDQLATDPARFQSRAKPAEERSVGQAVGAGFTLLILLVGVPVGLWLLTGPPPLPTGLPSRSDLTQPIAVEAILVVLLLVVWLAWLQFAACVLVEIVSLFRGRGLPRPVPLSGRSQQFARTLVSALLVGGVIAGGSTAASAAPVQHTGERAGVSASADASGQVRDAADNARSKVASAGDEVAKAGARDGGKSAGVPSEMRDVVGKLVYVVQPPEGHYHDNLWDIAERHLGDGRRWKEIFDLNDKRTQPDGRELVLGRLIQPGWVMVMPDDAVGLERVSAPASAETRPAADPARTDPGADQPAEGSAQADAGPAVSDSGAGLARDLILGGLLSASLLGALAAERRRRRGSAPDDDALEAEVALRVGADEDRAAWLDRSLRGLGSICRTERSALPPVFAVTVDDDEIWLRLAPSRTDAPSPWTAEDDGRVWKLNRDAAEPTELGHAPYPGLVCVGRDTDQRDVLVDLESAGGVVSVSGDDRLAGEVVSALAVQLVTNAWADDQQVTGQDLSPVLADLAGDRLRLVEDVEPLLADVVRTHPDRAAGEVLTGRLARRPGIAPEYVVLGTEPTRDLADRLLELTATGSRGFGVVSRGTITGTRWQMHIDETGTLNLPLLDVRVDAVRLTQSSAEQVAELLQRARTPRPVTGEGRVAIVAPTRSGDDAHWSAADARVGVLGTIETRTGGVLDPTRVPLATEMATFLALQGTAVHPSVLGASIWPRGVTAEVRDATIDRVREWLGSDADGNHYLRADETGRLSLGPGVAVDWDAFCELAIRARRSPSPREEAELLRRALHLVRGEFLDARPTSRYSWVARTNLETHVPDVVVDAAHRLVELCDQDGDPAGASYSGRAGLRLAPDSQLLWRAVVRSEYAHGGVEGAAAAVREMADVLTGRGADIEAETEALVAELLPTREQAAN